MGAEKNAESRTKAQKVLQKSEQQGRNEHNIDYDERNPFRYGVLLFILSFPSLLTPLYCSLDCCTLKPLYKGTPLVRCSYCSACYAADYKGQRCVICDISTVGASAAVLHTVLIA